MRRFPHKKSASLETFVQCGRGWLATVPEPGIFRAENRIGALWLAEAEEIRLGAAGFA